MLWVAKHLVRSRMGQGWRHLVLGDNMSVALVCGKGRASDKKLLVFVRKWAAIQLAANLVLVYRWVPSEFNVADEDSRRWEQSGRSGHYILECVLPVVPDSISPATSGPIGQVPLCAPSDTALCGSDGPVSPWIAWQLEQEQEPAGRTGPRQTAAWRPERLVHNEWDRRRDNHLAARSRSRMCEEAHLEARHRWAPVAPNHDTLRSLVVPRRSRAVQPSRVNDRVPGLSLLESNAVTRPTIASYRKAVQDLEAWASESDIFIDWNMPAVVEETILDYFDMLFASEFGPEVGSRLLAAVHALFPGTAGAGTSPCRGFLGHCGAGPG